MADRELTVEDLQLRLAPSVLRALRDVADRHIDVYRRADGTDCSDRVVVGADLVWWEQLRALGLYEPPAVGRWELTAEGRTLGDQLVQAARSHAH